tara:strand:+ start:1937 stop:3967 length:2031 start_codon:yes stop_codon:yes gene_type:complete
MANHFKIIVPFYNVEKWIKVCIRSIRAQDYTNFQCILIDDISTDNTVDIIKKEIGDDERFKLIVNREKKLALKNIYDGILESQPDDEDVIVTLDGDDWFANQAVLSRLNDEYENQDAWITYGSYAEFPTSVRGKFAQQIPAQVIDNGLLRRAVWMSSHLRSFKYKLWRRIDKKDMLDTEGNFYKMAWDLAFMFPMLEMAGNKSRYIKDILYVYNVSNPLNDHKVDNTLQINLEKEIREKPPYARIDLDGTHPALLLTPLRYDIVAKTMYARYKLKQIDSSWANEVYAQHLKVWNDFKEKDPEKNRLADFTNSFDSLLSSMEQEGFSRDPANAIPLYAGSPLNGAHRVAAAIALNKRVYTTGPTPEGQLDCSSEYFRNKDNFVSGGLDVKFLDDMALEYCKLKGNVYTVTLFPAANIEKNNAEQILSEYATVVYKKEATLSELGATNYILSLYQGEPWLGTAQNGFPGAHEKKAGCFGTANEGTITVYLVETDEPEKLNIAKKRIRDVCNVGNHSIHINDTHVETWRIASSVFNKNSLHFLNNSNPHRYGRFTHLFTQFKTWLISHLAHITQLEDYCVDASAVLSVYGLRECRDLDFLYRGENIETNVLDVNCHNFDAHDYIIGKDEIIFNPENHFYYEGIKFATLETIRDMKINRNEEKDRRDVALINSCLGEDNE